MKRRIQVYWFSIFVLIPLLAGCGSSNQAKLVGVWQVDQVESVSKKIQLDWDKDDFKSEPKLTVRFHRSGIFETQTKMGNIDSAKKGTWKTISFDSSTNVMLIECELPLQKTEHKIEFIDARTIRWIPPNLAGTKKRLKFVKGR